MKRHTLALLAAALLIACGGTSTTTAGTSVATTESPSTTAAATTTAATEAGGTLAMSTSDLGDIITDADGRTLYLFMPDGQGDPTCYDDCAATWPAFTETVTAGAGLDASLLATAPRTDGAEQVTYNGWPLYYFAGDEAPGDTNGQGLNDIWWVVDSAGEAVSG